jgi:hypothetical protein
LAEYLLPFRPAFFAESFIQKPANFPTDFIQGFIGVEFGIVR